jgi:hypothetical protein
MTHKIGIQNYSTSIVGINKANTSVRIISKKKFISKVFGLLYHGTKLVKKTQKKITTKVRIIDLVPVPNARKRYHPHFHDFDRISKTYPLQSLKIKNSGTLKKILQVRPHFIVLDV